MQIKTIVKPYEQLQKFDEEVNSLLADGWHLRERKIQRVPGEINEAFNIPEKYILYAGLER